MSDTDEAPAAVEPGAAAVLSGIPAPAAPADEAPAKPARKASRSGTSGAERRRRAKAASGDKAPRASSRAPKAAPLDKRLAEGLQLVGTCVGLVDAYDGAVITHNADRLAGALAELADKSPGVKRLLEAALAAGDNAGVVVVLATVALPILCHHGIVPAKFGALAQLVGTAPPDADGSGAGALGDLLGGLLTGDAGAEPAAA